MRELEDRRFEEQRALDQYVPHSLIQPASERCCDGEMTEEHLIYKTNGSIEQVWKCDECMEEMEEKDVLDMINQNS